MLEDILKRTQNWTNIYKEENLNRETGREDDVVKKSVENLLVNT